MARNTPLLFLGTAASQAAEEAARGLLGSGSWEDPDLLILSPEGRTIGIGAVRRAIAWSRYAPVRAPVKVVLVGPAEKLSPEAASALLKSLEESPPYLRFVLFGRDRDAIIPTVRSRCRTVWTAEERDSWAEALRGNGYSEEEVGFLLELVADRLPELGPFLGERRRPLEEWEEAVAEMSTLSWEELLARFQGYHRDPIRRRAAAREILGKLREISLSQVTQAAERLAQAGREVTMDFLWEYLLFLREGGKGLCPREEGRRFLERKLSLSPGEIRDNANLRLLVEVVLLWPKSGYCW